MPRKKKSAMAELTNFELDENGLMTGRFDTLERAVIVATKVFNPISVKKNREAIGVILQDEEGKYYFNANISRKADANYTFLKPKSHKVAALWHTHGPDEAAHQQMYSPKDLEVAEQFGVPSFLATADGSLKVWKKGDEEIKQFHKGTTGGKKVRTAYGTPITLPDGTPWTTLPPKEK